MYGTVNYGLRQRYFWLVVALIMSVPQLYARPLPVRLRRRGTLLVAVPERRAARLTAAAVEQTRRRLRRERGAE